ncbi:helix-turn-helix domain-containing protein [Actinoplanes awajinensis]|uniref:Transcriptional regulator n=1 Tax=Actinoplanes awajinensis subsp. mycoplanecinus TaxID=135947 RepID=A0A101JF28_9ACTN|nr:helix-turn-helix transcriptional regulator [Actinoplanes awajinensis]KUL25678.1 transcriptional regulator [Actinoplanes awajinensis subsp. mycoplanecinus]
MVKNRQAIPSVDFSAPAGIPDAVEVISLAQLRSRTGPAVLAAPQRPTFHHLLTLDRGTLGHTVDFTRHEVTATTWLWVRPGQVQQWGDLSGADGTLILFEPDFLGPATAAAAGIDDPHAPARYPVAPGHRRRLAAATRHLADMSADCGPLALETRHSVLRHLLAVLVLQLAALAPARTGPSPQSEDTYLRFRDALERDFTRVHRLEDYARALGYSARTLSRAAQAAAGVNGKELIDRRIVLEAQRLLAHSDHTAAQIAARLGFASATNFSKYFHTRTGVTPIAFRGSSRTT